MEDLAGFAVILTVLGVVFGSIAVCGVLGAWVASLVPAVHRQPARIWHRWIAIAVLAGTVAGTLTAVVGLAGSSATRGRALTGVLPIACWAASFVAGAGSRILDAPRRA